MTWASHTLKRWTINCALRPAYLVSGHLLNMNLGWGGQCHSSLHPPSPLHPSLLSHHHHSHHPGHCHPCQAVLTAPLHPSLCGAEHQTRQHHRSGWPVHTGMSQTCFAGILCPRPGGCWHPRRHQSSLGRWLCGTAAACCRLVVGTAIF